MSARLYRAAIIGCGRKAATIDDEDRCRINYSIPPDAHAGAYWQFKNVRVVAAADPNEPKRRLMKDRWGVAAVYADYREMLDGERPDLVSVTTRTPLHAEATLAAAAAGARGVLCEKAMATSLREADEMIDACHRAGTKLLINHTRRWHPTYEAAQRELHSGTIGALRCIVGTCPGPLIHNGTHLFDLMRLFGGDVAWVSGELRPGDGQDVPGRAMLRFHSGVMGFVDLDGGLGLGIELQGEAGRIFIDPAVEGLTIWRYEAPPRPRADRPWYQGGPCGERAARHVARDGAKGTLVAALQELIDCIEHDRECRSSGHDGRAALELALAVYHSHAADGDRVALPLEDRSLTVQSR